MLGVLIKVSNVTAGKPADLVLESPLQNQRELLTTVAVFQHAHAGGNRKELQRTLRILRQGQFINGNTGGFFPPAQLGKALASQKPLEGCWHVTFRSYRLGHDPIIE